MNELARSATRCGVGFLLGGMLAGAMPVSHGMHSTLMPVPASVQEGPGRLPFTSAFRVAFSGTKDARLTGALDRTLRALETRSGLTLPRTATGEYALAEGAAAATLVIECASSGEPVPRLGEDESYELVVSPTGARLRAPTGRGILHGLATIQQLLQSDASGWHWPGVTITDRPRYPWRGLMIDVCRHWQPMDVIKRNLDGMALVKLNVLHLHLTEDQGFRIESRTFPKLHEQGSDGFYYTQAEMREIIAFAAQRGIRVVPEFDIPGHATSWLVGHPELGSAPGPYIIERKWGIFDPVLDPTNEEVYRVLGAFLGEMAALFPDPYLHIGGDENNGKHWSANAYIQQFIREHNLKDNAGLHAHFNTRVNAILRQHGKNLVGWDEILHPDLPAGSVVHSWRGPEGIADATARGFATILSNGYYIDLMKSAEGHYLNDPIPSGSKLTPAQQQLVLGGEATMWAEWVSPETIDSRIWPRTAAIAERLWSPQDVRDVPDMYRRLEVVSRRLEEVGLRQKSYLDPALRRLAGDQATAYDLRALRHFVDLVEPVKEYKRGGHQPDATQFTPLTGLVDCARADSAPSRELAKDLKLFLTAPTDAAAGQRAVARLTEWNSTATHLLARLPALSPQLAEAKPLLEALARASDAAANLVTIRLRGQAPTSEGSAMAKAAFAQLAEARAAVEFPVAPALGALVEPQTSLTPTP